MTENGNSENPFRFEGFSNEPGSGFPSLQNKKPKVRYRNWLDNLIDEFFEGPHTYDWVPRIHADKPVQMDENGQPLVPVGVLHYIARFMQLVGIILLLEDLRAFVMFFWHPVFIPNNGHAISAFHICAFFGGIFLIVVGSFLITPRSGTIYHIEPAKPKLPEAPPPKAFDPSRDTFGKGRLGTKGEWK